MKGHPGGQVYKWLKEKKVEGIKSELIDDIINTLLDVLLKKVP